MTRLFVHVEEPSMRAAMEVLLPRMIDPGRVAFTVVDHQSKQALLTNLTARLRGYRKSAAEDIRVLVLVDRDDEDCLALKEKLESCAHAAGCPTKSAPDNAGRFQVVNRVVVEELEAWFFGDTDAICAAYPGVPATLGSKARYRDPDAVKGGTWEALLRVLKRAGHYAGSERLPKIEVARRVTPHMTATINRSHSFRAFATGLQALLA